MPHFVLDCSEDILSLADPKEIMSTVYNTAEATGLFAAGDIKVRLNPFTHYTIGTSTNDFIHIFANIMEGRTVAQKKDLSERLIRALKALFPEVPIISINIRDFEKATYCNRTMV